MYRHFQQWNHRTQNVISYANKKSKTYTVRVVLCTELQARKLEAALIAKYKPRDNQQGTQLETTELYQSDKDILQQYYDTNAERDRSNDPF